MLYFQFVSVYANNNRFQFNILASGNWNFAYIFKDIHVHEMHIRNVKEYGDGW